ncbi:CaiB/BaiF CoA transferase family protein [Salinarimonas soli]|uniref:CoA transferase n=1 Tax=Salinarimonas soli TaxID=1638099 RepID=A0A5B2VF27_9HYPH|nr:CoA transferase [Salinarimonas soli]KAA2237216.1 CoA transferase [Salinarimonas soli]
MSLSGIRVVDLTRVLSGPFCTALLADMGADVIKVEAPGEGDQVRGQGYLKDGYSWYFANFNRNKRSIALDLYSPEGRAVLERLIATADVVVDNFRPGVMDKMGFSRERLEAIRPGIVAASVNGFGATGPYADRPAFDFIAQAMSGFMSLNGRAGDPPLRAGPPVSDMVAGLYGALGIVAALVGRERTGRGEALDVSLLGGLVSFLGFHATNYFASGAAPPRTGNDHPIAAPYGLFATADGEVAIAPSSDVFYERLMRALGLDEALADPRFATNDLRVANRAAINGVIEGATRARPSAHWIEVLNRAGVPCGPVLGVEEVFEDPQVRHQGLAVTYDQPGGGEVTVLRLPVDFSRGPFRIRRPAPGLGEHTDEILAELGLSPARE